MKGSLAAFVSFVENCCCRGNYLRNDKNAC